MTGDKPQVTIYTDGGADPNPGPGGWGVVLLHDKTGHIKELSGGEAHTTNNRMELTAAIVALTALKEPCEVLLFTDSEYMRSGITRWVETWAADGWMRGKGRKKPVENADLWRVLLDASAQHEITWKWVRGHSGNRFNERADQLATLEIRKFYEALPVSERVDAEVYLVVSARDGQGFWAASVRYEGDEQLLTGIEYEVTANQLDIMAAVHALQSLPEGVSVMVYSLSDYLRNGASQWIAGWKKRGWMTKKGDPVKNQALWQALDAEINRRDVTWPSTKGDSSLEFAFEDLATRAQEEFEYLQGEQRMDDEDNESGGEW